MAALPLAEHRALSSRHGCCRREGSGGGTASGWRAVILLLLPLSLSCCPLQRLALHGPPAQALAAAAAALPLPSCFLFAASFSRRSFASPHCCPLLPPLPHSFKPQHSLTSLLPLQHTPLVMWLYLLVALLVLPIVYLLIVPDAVSPATATPPARPPPCSLAAAWRQRQRDGAQQKHRRFVQREGHSTNSFFVLLSALLCPPSPSLQAHSPPRFSILPGLLTGKFDLRNYGPLKLIRMGYDAVSSTQHTAAGAASAASGIEERDEGRTPEEFKSRCEVRQRLPLCSLFVFSSSFSLLPLFSIFLLLSAATCSACVCSTTT